MRFIDKLPANLKEYIINNGVDLADGYIRFLNEDEIGKMVELLESCPIWHDGIPFATTVFGDVLAWDDGYIMLYKLSEEDYTVILSGTEFFFDNLKDEEYVKDFFDIELYKAAINKCGRIDRDQCYVLTPIPRLGGARIEKYLNVGELFSYITILL